jgi:hypothetical protein
MRAEASMFATPRALDYSLADGSDLDTINGFTANMDDMSVKTL